MIIGKEFIKRQKYLLQQVGNNGVAIIFASKEPRHHRKTIYPYRQDSDFYYLTGFPESEAIAVFIPNRKQGEYILFNLDKDPKQEIWTGVRTGQLKACENYGANQAFSINASDTMIADLISGRERIFFNIGDHEDHECIMNWIKHLSEKERNGINAPTDFVDVGKIVHEMRLHKDTQEIALLRRAAEISASAHLHAMQVCCPDMMEYELEAEIVYEFVRNGGRSPAFEPIIAGGANACTLHYSQNNAQLKSGELVLIDAGVEYKSYAGDITRTFPVNGRFNEQQKAIYQAVLDMQLAVIAHIRPGVSWIELEHIAERVITEKLIALELLHGELNELLVKRAFKPFYMHHIGHWLGLDVHDVGKYKVNDKWRLLESGMVFTVEPGIYISENIPGVDKKWWNIGVRIEDTVLVTENGCEVLTSNVPKSIKEIEKIMQKT